MTSMEKVSICGLVEIYMKGDGRKVKSMEKVVK